MRWLTLTTMLVVAGLGSARAADSDVTVVGGLDFGFKNLRLDFSGAGNLFNTSFVTVSPNVGLSYKSVYASLAYDKSIHADKTTGQDPTGATAIVTDYSRTDSTFTLGYRLNQSFSLFAGYTKGVSKFTTTTAAVVLIVTDTEFTETGPFAGIAYSVTFSNKGTLGLSVGYARLDGELKRNVNPGGSGNFDVRGDTTGLSYGLSWSGPLTASLGYRIALKSTRYETKDLNDLTERYNSVFIGIMNYF